MKLLEEAARCRRLAFGIPDVADPTRTALLRLAEELEEKAAAAIEAAGRPSG